MSDSFWIIVPSIPWLELHVRVGSLLAFVDEADRRLRDLPEEQYSENIEVVAARVLGERIIDARMAKGCRHPY